MFFITKLHAPTTCAIIFVIMKCSWLLSLLPSSLLSSKLFESILIHHEALLLQFELDQSLCVQFRASQYIMCLNRTSEWNIMAIWISRELLLFYFERLDILCAWIWHPSEKLWPFELLKSFHCSILSVSIYYAP